MENKQSLLNKIKKLGIIYVGLISIFVITIVASYAIPNKRIDWHVSESIPQLMSEGVYSKPFFNTRSAQLDNFTDSWMLNLAISADNSNPLKSALENPHRVSQKYANGEIDKVQNLEATAKDKSAPTMSYSRYWHGYLGILRPLLLFLNYTEIRFINMCALFLLFIIVNALLKRKLGTKIMVSFFLSMMMVMFIIVPMSLQFSSIFYVTFISMIIMLLYNKEIEENNLAIYMFFIIGSITSFLDLLTVPLVSLGVPLIAYMLLLQKQSNNNTESKFIIKQKSNNKQRDIILNLIEILKNSIIWAIGYGATWATKWVIATIVLKENVIKDALNQILSRTSDSSGQTIISAKAVIEQNMDVIYTDFILKLLLIILVVWIICMIFYRKDRKTILNLVPILLIGLMPFVWYIVLKNHSYIHFWFTYRNLVITTFAVLAFMSESIDISKYKHNIL